MNQKKTLAVAMGGIVTDLDVEFWREFSDRVSDRFAIRYVLSTWTEFPLPEKLDRLGGVEVFSEEQAPLRKRLENTVNRYSRHAPEAKPLNTMFMWNRWRDLRDRLGTLNPDVVLKSRADIQICTEDSRVLKDLILAVPRFHDRQLAIPAGGDWNCGINDIIALGSMPCMAYYLSIWDRMAEYYDQTKWFHPEWLLRYHLIDIGKFSVRRFVFPFSLRGRRYSFEDSVREYVDRFALGDSLLSCLVENRARIGLVRALGRFPGDVIRRFLGKLEGKCLRGIPRQKYFPSNFEAH